jgi:hypothetical protein
MTKHQGLATPSEFKSMDEFRKHYFPKSPARSDRDRDICVAAEQLAARTIRSVRRQLAAQ